MTSLASIRIKLKQLEDKFNREIQALRKEFDEAIKAISKK